MDQRAFTILIPAYNEGALLASALENVHARLESLLPQYPDSRMVVVDDGSSDETPQVIDAFARAHPSTVRACRHEVNRGLTEAMRTGCAAIETPNVVMFDADMSYGPETIDALVHRLGAGDVALVLASPYMEGGRVSNVPFVRRVASRYANLLLSACVGGRIKTFTGMVRACETAMLAQALASNAPGEFNAWMVAAAMRDGRVVVEVPAHLDWPAARVMMPSRISWPKLFARTAQVLIVARTLAFPGRSVPLEQHA